MSELRHPHTHASLLRVLERMTTNSRTKWNYQYVWETLYHLACRSDPPLDQLDEEMGRWRGRFPQKMLAAFWDWAPGQIRTKYGLVASGQSHVWNSEHLPSHDQFLKDLGAAAPS
jgi:hypothetical protein